MKFFKNLLNKLKNNEAINIINSSVNAITINDDEVNLGINSSLIEIEINKRVDFKMGEYNESLKNIKNRYRNAFTNDRSENERFANAIELVQERFDKERYMGTIYDGQFLDNIKKNKNKLVDEIAKNLIDKKDKDLPRKLSKINNLIEKHIYGNNI